MTNLRLDFCDFWPGFSKTDNFFTKLLRLRYEVDICDQPDFILYSAFGRHHRLYTCPRIFFSGESTWPDFRECDFALTGHYLDDPRHLRLPLYVLYATPAFDPTALLATPNPLPQRAEDPKLLLAQKNMFCAMVVSNAHRRSRKRIEFFQRLNRHKKVDSAGHAFNNIGGTIAPGPAAKLAFLQAYKFNIAFENRSLPGYTTEKIFQTMQARCIPIYWGSPRIHEEFNPKSFLNYFDFPDEEALIERILQIDGDDGLYLEYLRQPYFHNNQPNEFFSAARLLDFFEMVFTAKIRPVGSRRKFFQIGRWILVKKNKPSP
jgi:hypothetical protein